MVRHSAVVLVAVFVISPLAMFVGDMYKERPDFCVSCHLPSGKELHKEKMELMKARPVSSLAGVHNALKINKVQCIGCHQGADFNGKAHIRWLEVKNTFKYFVLSFKEPKKVDAPVDDRICVKCHDSLKLKSEKYLFHYFDSHNGMKQVSCAKCHTAHARPDGDGKLLLMKNVLAQCSLCHKYAEDSPMVRKTLGLPDTL